MRIFYSLDMDGDSMISFQEYFIHELCQKALAELSKIEEMRDTFLKYDRNGDGLISAAELVEVHREFHLEITLEMAENMIQNLDENHDGQVSFDEFLTAYRK